MKDKFSTFDIVKALKIPRERLREWMKRDFVKPTIAADGQGSKAVFTRQDVYGVELFRQLVDYGFDRDMARLFVEESRKRLHEDIERNIYLIIRFGKVIASRKHAAMDKHFWKKLTPRDQHALQNYGSQDQHAFFFAGDDDIFGLTTGSKEAGGGLFDNNWRFIHIINLRTLQRETDLALGKL